MTVVVRPQSDGTIHICYKETNHVLAIVIGKEGDKPYQVMNLALSMAKVPELLND